MAIFAVALVIVGIYIGISRGYLIAASIMAAILVLNAIVQIAKNLGAHYPNSRNGGSIVTLKEMGELLGGQVVRSQGVRELCARCGKAFERLSYLQDGSTIISTVGSENNQAYQCTKPDCGRWYCEDCAKQEIRSTGKTVRLIDFDLCCECGSADFHRLPVTYIQEDAC